MSVVNITNENFEQYLSSHEIVILKFSADWCGPCKSFAPIYEETAEVYPEILFGEVDSEKMPQLAADFGVRSVPFLVILRQRVVIYAQGGALPASAFKDLIEQAKQLNMADVKKNLEEHDTDG